PIFRPAAKEVGKGEAAAARLVEGDGSDEEKAGMAPGIGRVRPLRRALQALLRMNYVCARHALPDWSGGGGEATTRRTQDAFAFRSRRRPLFSQMLVELEKLPCFAIGTEALADQSNSCIGEAKTLRLILEKLP